MSRAGVFALALAAALAAGCRTEPVRDAEATTRPAPPETRAPVAPTARPPETTPPEPPPEPATPAPDAAPEGAPTGDAIRAALVGFAKVLDGGSVAPNGDLWGALADPAAGVTMAAVTLPKDDGAASLDVDWKGGDAVRRVVDEGESALFRPLYGPARALVRDLALGLPSATCRDAHCVRVLADGGQHVFRFGVAPGGELRLLGVLRAEDPRLAAEPDTLAQIRAVFDAAVDGHRPESWPR